MNAQQDDEVQYLYLWDLAADVSRFFATTQEEIAESLRKRGLPIMDPPPTLVSRKDAIARVKSLVSQGCRVAPETITLLGMEAD